MKPTSTVDFQRKVEIYTGPTWGWILVFSLFNLLVASKSRNFFSSCQSSRVVESMVVSLQLFTHYDWLTRKLPFSRNLMTFPHIIAGTIGKKIIQVEPIMQKLWETQ